MPKRQEIDRIIIGNQIALMRALSDMLPENSRGRRELALRVVDLKDWWRREYREELGFSSAYGDQDRS